MKIHLSEREFEILNIRAKDNYYSHRHNERSYSLLLLAEKGANMSNAKEASEAEALGMKLLNFCRKKATEKDLLTVLEVRRVMRF